MQAASLVLSICVVLCMYLTFNVVTIVTYIGLLSIVLYAGLEMMSTVSSDVDYTWKTDKTMSIIYAASMSLFSMSVAIYLINNL